MSVLRRGGGLLVEKQRPGQPSRRGTRSGGWENDRRRTWAGIEADAGLCGRGGGGGNQQSLMAGEGARLGDGGGRGPGRIRVATRAEPSGEHPKAPALKLPL